MKEKIKKVFKNLSSISKDAFTPKTIVGKHNLLVREKWLEKTITALPAGGTILDAGAGELQYKRFCSHLKYTSQDFGQYDGTGTNEGLQTKTWDNSKLDIVSDIIDIPVEDESFDSIMCIEVFEHIPEPAFAVKEFKRILKKKGKVIITAPFSSMTHFAPYYFANGYSKYWYHEMFRKFGFKLLEISFNGNYFEYVAQEVRRIEMMAKKYSVNVISSIDKLAIRKILNTLEKFSMQDTGSNEFCCFGLHVVAEKM